MAIEARHLLAPLALAGGVTLATEHDAYSKALERLLRDLKVEASAAPDG